VFSCRVKPHLQFTGAGSRVEANHGSGQVFEALDDIVDRLQRPAAQMPGEIVFGGSLSTNYINMGDTTAATTSAVVATNDLNDSGKYFMPSCYAKEEREENENLIGRRSRRLAAESRSGVNSGGTFVANGRYFVPCVIGILRSLSLAIMSSADVSGFTIFSM